MARKLSPSITAEDHEKRLKAGESREEVLLDVLEDRWKNDILLPAVKLVPDPDDVEAPGGFASILLTTAIFEPLGVIRKGANGSKERFKSGFRFVFGDVLSGADCERAYKALRCGLFHAANLRGGLGLHNSLDPITLSSDWVFISPVPFAERTLQKVLEYMCKLRGLPRDSHEWEHFRKFLEQEDEFAKAHSFQWPGSSSSDQSAGHVTISAGPKT